MRFSSRLRASPRCLPGVPAAGTVAPGSSLRTQLLAGVGGGSERLPSPPVRSPARWDKPGRVAESQHLKPIDKSTVLTRTARGLPRPPT